MKVFFAFFLVYLLAMLVIIGICDVMRVVWDVAKEARVLDGLRHAVDRLREEIDKQL